MNNLKHLQRRDRGRLGAFSRGGDKNAAVGLLSPFSHRSRRNAKQPGPGAAAYVLGGLFAYSIQPLPFLDTSFSAIRLD